MSFLKNSPGFEYMYIGQFECMKSWIISSGDWKLQLDFLYRIAIDLFQVLLYLVWAIRTEGMHNLIDLYLLVVPFISLYNDNIDT